MKFLADLTNLTLLHMKNLLILLLLFFSMAAHAQNKVVLVIHGGAGTITPENMTPELERTYRQKLSEALEKGYAVLERGGTSLEAVTTAIQIMEESPLFNAGRGAVFTSEGRNELDASIMDGKTGQAGAVAGVTTIRSPILAAQAVMQKSPHVMLTGTGAEAFAREQGLEQVENSYFFDQRRYDQLKRLQQLEQGKDKEGSLKDPEWGLFEGKKFGTVGAVALDSQGNLAAGTSTGGMTNKRWGRVGDSPIIGAGTYANNQSCAVSATGHGEFFIRNVVAYDVAARMKYQGLSLQNAAEAVVMKTLKEQGGEGGIIAVDNKGNIAMPFNTSGMYRGYMNQKGKPQVFIFQK
jgi:beta-aspartyl-peptidase (threonine type)